MPTFELYNEPPRRQATFGISRRFLTRLPFIPSDFLRFRPPYPRATGRLPSNPKTVSGPPLESTSQVPCAAACTGDDSDSLYGCCERRCSSRSSTSGGYRSVLVRAVKQVWMEKTGLRRVISTYIQRKNFRISCTRSLVRACPVLPSGRGRCGPARVSARSPAGSRSRVSPDRPQ